MAQVNRVQSVQVNLSVASLDDDERLGIFKLLSEMGPKSGVYTAHNMVKEAVDKALQSGGVFAAAAAEVKRLALELSAAESAMVSTAARFDKDLSCLKAVAEGHCATEAELNTLGFNQKPPRAAREPLSAPVSVSAKPGKERGSMVVQVKRVGRIPTYAAEISPEPVGPGTWQALPGTGSLRRLSGYQSGMQYWVRFRAVRAKEQSDWSEAVPVVAR